MTNLPPDAGTVCMALELDAGYLADVFRREAGTALRQAATLVEDGSSTLVPQLEHARHLLLVADAFEVEWETQESDAATSLAGTEATPGARPSVSETAETSPQSGEIVPESLRAGR